MGTSISSAFDSEKAEADVLEKLQALHKTMTEKITATSGELQDQAKMDGSLPVLTIVDKVEKYYVNVSTAPSEEIEGALKDILSGKFIAGVVGFINVGLNAVLGNAKAGETQETDYHIIFANNSLLRFDYMVYKYNFKSSGISDKYESGFCYYFQVGVLDLSKVSPEILMYELTKAVMGPSHQLSESDVDRRLTELADELENLATYVKKLYATIHELKEAARAPEFQGNSEREKAIEESGLEKSTIEKREEKKTELVKF